MSERKPPQLPVKLREVAGFQSTPFGMFDLSVAPPPPNAEISPSAPPQLLTETTPAPAPIVATAPIVAEHAPQRSKVIPADSPRAVVKAAKARIKELRAELRRMQALQKELAELERLVKAAREKPKSPVRALRSA